MKRQLSFKEKLMRIIIALVLVVAVGGTGIYGVSSWLDGDAPTAEALDGLAGGADEDDLAVDLSMDEADGKYGDISRYVLHSSFLDMKELRREMTGFRTPVSIPFSADQDWIDTRRDADLTNAELTRVIDLKMAEWDREFAELSGAELEKAVRAKVTEEILRNPVFADMLVQALMQYPQVAEQNKWLEKFAQNFDDAYNRSESDGRLMGLNAFMHYENAKAKAKKDTSKLVVNMETNSETGAFEYFYSASKLAELFDQFFEFEGYKATAKSSENWRLVAKGSAAKQRTEKADKQTSKPVYMFTHYTKLRNVSVKLGFNELDKRVELFVDAAPRAKIRSTGGPGDTIIDNNKYKLTILYVYANGGTAAGTYTGYYASGSYYEVASPKANKPGFVPDRSVVRGGPITRDTVEKVVYYGKDVSLYNATINYLYRAGGTAAPSFSKKMATGDSVTRVSPVIPDYKADRTSVTITMGTKDVVVNVYYDKITRVQDYALTLKCVDAGTGYTLRTVPQGRYKEGAPYTVYAPTITGYTANQGSVSGIMPGRDHTVVITYTRKKDGNGKKDPEADPENAPGYNPGIGDNKPDDGPGEYQPTKPPVVDHDNTPPPTPSMPGGDNRNDDGADTTKPVTKPIVEDSKPITVVDPGGSSSNVEKEPINNGTVSDDDPVGYSDAAPIAETQSAAEVQSVAAPQSIQSDTAADGAGDFQPVHP